MLKNDMRYLTYNFLDAIDDDFEKGEKNLENLNSIVWKNPTISNRIVKYFEGRRRRKILRWGYNTPASFLRG